MSADPLLVVEPLLAEATGDPMVKLNRRLAELGRPPLGYATPMAQINDAMFELQAAGAVSHDLRRAWDQLRIVRSRLARDFLAVTCPAVNGAALGEALFERAPPACEIDAGRLAPLQADVTQIASRATMAFPEGDLPPLPRGVFKQPIVSVAPATPAFQDAAEVAGLSA